MDFQKSVATLGGSVMLCWKGVGLCCGPSPLSSMGCIVNLVCVVVPVLFSSMAYVTYVLAMENVLC